MAKAVIMLALIKEKLNNPNLMKDCVYFDEKDGLRAGNRIKRSMRKIRDMSQSMYRDIKETQRQIKISHGRKVNPRAKGQKSVTKNKTEEL